MPIGLTILLCLLGAVGLVAALVKGLQRAEATDHPLERVLWRVLLTALVLAGPGWLLHRTFASASDGGGTLGGMAFGFMLAGLAAVVGILLAIVWGHEIGRLMARPFTSLFLGSDEEPAARPLYSPALARRKLGRSAEAIAEIRSQLEQFPDDVEGWLLIAEIQMEDLHDFDQAAATIRQFVSRPGQTPQHIILGLSRLADWHLKYRHDYSAARALFQDIVERFSDSPQARPAYHRLAHLAEMEQYAEAQAHLRAVPKADRHLGLQPRAGAESDEVTRGAEEVARLRQHLEQYPLDREPREKIALLYAYEQHRPDLCAEQVEYLLGLPDALPSEIGRWLNLLADVQIREAHDAEAARQTLQRLIEWLPDSPNAQQAQRRLGLLATELHATQANQPVALAPSFERKEMPVPPWWPKPPSDKRRRLPPE